MLMIEVEEGRQTNGTNQTRIVESKYRAQEGQESKIYWWLILHKPAISTTKIGHIR